MVESHPRGNVRVQVEVDLPPADFVDPVIEAYKAGIDRSLLLEDLKLTPAERAEKS